MKQQPKRRRERSRTKTSNMVRVIKVKYPRVLVSPARHIALQKEANTRGMTLEDLAEEKFKIADNQKRLEAKKQNGYN